MTADLTSTARHPRTPWDPQPGETPEEFSAFWAWLQTSPRPAPADVNPNLSPAAVQVRRRMRLGGKSTRWVAFSRGEAVGVYSTEARALMVSNIVRAFRVDQVPGGLGA